MHQTESFQTKGSTEKWSGNLLIFLCSPVPKVAMQIFIETSCEISFYRSSGVKHEGEYFQSDGDRYLVIENPFLPRYLPNRWTIATGGKKSSFCELDWLYVDVFNFYCF